MNLLINSLSYNKMPIHVEGIPESKYHYLSAILVKINLVEKHQWILKLVGKYMNRNTILHSLKETPHKNTY